MSYVVNECLENYTVPDGALLHFAEDDAAATAPAGSQLAWPPQEKLPPSAGLWPGLFLMYRSLCAP